MALKIKASSLFTAHSLKIDSAGVVFMEASAVGRKRRFRFDEIDFILMSPTHELSFQVGLEVFSIPTNPNKPKHQEVIDTLVHQVKQSRNPGNGPTYS